MRCTGRRSSCSGSERALWLGSVAGSDCLEQVVFELDDASGTVARLRERGVFVDARGRLLRFGPAPYVTDDEIERALAAFREVAR